MAASLPIRRRPRLSRSWVWGAAAIAASFVALVMFLVGCNQAPPTPVDPTIARLARIVPIPVHFTRSDVSPGSFEERRLRGLEAYEFGDYDTALDLLARAVEQRPDHDEACLYLGSAELLDNSPEMAVLHLDTVVARSKDPTLQSEALWQLANAKLILEEREGALEALQRLQAIPSRHRAAADSLVLALEAPKPGP